MTSPNRRKELRAEYRQRLSEAGVYALSNMATGRVLVAATTDLAAARNRLDFAKATDGRFDVDSAVVDEDRRAWLDRTGHCR